MAKNKKIESRKINLASKGKERPPIVAVLGHVDHGKTSLLDYIRKSRVAQGEAGGITQSIGAYQVQTKDQKITFIDTPGHQAFSKMRQRSGFVADLVVLVVAADDGVMPQTQESITHIKNAEVPFIVVVNKIDLASANIERVYDQLVKEGVLVESRGGKIVSVPVSAKTGQGIDDLLEMILLVGEMSQLQSNPSGPLEAYVIESNLTKGGAQATILVKDGTLKVGDEITVEGMSAKLKALVDDKGERLSSAGPSTPVKVLGFSKVPPIGAKVLLQGATPVVAPTKSAARVSLPTDEGKMKLILKADSLGSLEALVGSLPSEVLVIQGEVGEINESDVLLAKTSGASILGFRVKANPSVKKLAEDEAIKIKTFEIIYELLETLEKELLDEAAEKEIKILGRAEIIAEFPFGEGRIAGCRVTEGRIAKNDQLELKRDEITLGQVRIVSMKHANEEIKLAEKGSEFGAILKTDLDFRVGDMLISPARK